ncbi:MAG: hypothetical protein U9R74_00280 [Pseudomonadota bacterium]|nr:hypothetical protein [Pseudomonadota bacterium]
MQLHLERGEEIQRVTRSLPADIYNKLTVLFARGARQPLFVPIRTMQYLAVVDSEETLFVDGNNRRYIAISWQRFRPADRKDFNQPVAFECVYYIDNGPEVMKRLQAAFLEALTLFESRQSEPGKDDRTVLPFDRRH